MSFHEATLVINSTVVRVTQVGINYHQGDDLHEFLAHLEHCAREIRCRIARDMEGSA